MRNLSDLNNHRVEHPFCGMGDEKNGAFVLPGPCNQDLTVIASNGEGWDHVSVSSKNRCPNWQEMDWVKKQCFEDYEVAIQYHIPRENNINIHDNCLHLWRPWTETAEIPMPPMEFV